MPLICELKFPLGMFVPNQVCYFHIEYVIPRVVGSARAFQKSDLKNNPALAPPTIACLSFGSVT